MHGVNSKKTRQRFESIVKTFKLSLFLPIINSLSVNEKGTSRDNARDERERRTLKTPPQQLTRRQTQRVRARYREQKKLLFLFSLVSLYFSLSSVIIIIILLSLLLIFFLGQLLSTYFLMSKF